MSENAERAEASMTSLREDVKSEVSVIKAESKATQARLECVVNKTESALERMQADIKQLQNDAKRSAVITPGQPTQREDSMQKWDPWARWHESNDDRSTNVSSSTSAKGENEVDRCTIWVKNIPSALAAVSKKKVMAMLMAHCPAAVAQAATLKVPNFQRSCSITFAEEGDADRFWESVASQKVVIDDADGVEVAVYFKKDRSKGGRKVGKALAPVWTDIKEHLFITGKWQQDYKLGQVPAGRGRTCLFLSFPWHDDNKQDQLYDLSWDVCGNPLFSPHEDALRRWDFSDAQIAAITKRAEREFRTARYRP